MIMIDLSRVLAEIDLILSLVIVLLVGVDNDWAWGVVDVVGSLIR